MRRWWQAASAQRIIAWTVVAYIVAGTLAALGLVGMILSSRDTTEAPATRIFPTPSAAERHLIRDVRYPIVRAVYYCDDLTPDERPPDATDGGYCAIPVSEARGMSYEEWRALPEVQAARDAIPVELSRTGTQAVTLHECLNTGAGGVLSASDMRALVGRHDWTPWTADEITWLFLEESGGCIAVVSVTNDWGACQVHYSDDRAEWVDFPRVISDPGYAISVCHAIFEKRIAADICGICAWYAGRGVLWH